MSQSFPSAHTPERISRSPILSFSFRSPDQSDAFLNRIFPLPCQPCSRAHRCTCNCLQSGAKTACLIASIRNVQNAARHTNLHIFISTSSYKKLTRYISDSPSTHSTTPRATNPKARKPEPYLDTPTIPTHRSIIASPSGVSTDSGWNCTPSIGRRLCRIPMTTPSGLCVTTSRSGDIDCHGSSLYGWTSITTT